MDTEKRIERLEKISKSNIFIALLVVGIIIALIFFIVPGMQEIGSGLEKTVNGLEKFGRTYQDTTSEIFNNIDAINFKINNLISAIDTSVPVTPTNEPVVVVEEPVSSAFNPY